MTDVPTIDAPLPLMTTSQVRAPLLPLNTNTPSNTDKPTEKIKLKKKTLHLPHPSSLDVLPSPTDKWSATTHPIKAWVVGYVGYHISYKNFYFHQSHVLLTQAFTISTTASTVGDGGTPKGSTKLDAICGSNCTMDKDEFRMFAQLVLGLRPRKQHAARRFCCHI